MQILLLHLDDALELQPDFVGAALTAGAREVEDKTCGLSLRLWSRNDRLWALKQSLAHVEGIRKHQPRLCFTGSGDFHHVTALLLADALEEFECPVTVIHIDNHPDWVHFSKGLHCGSWINAAAAHPNVNKIITLGVCSNDLTSPDRKGANLDLLRCGKLELYPYAHPPSRVKGRFGSGASYSQLGSDLHWVLMSNLGESNFIDRLLQRIKTDAVYITIDKDSLVHSDAVTNWDQGCMSLPYVLWIIHEIGLRHRIIGADVTGDYSEPRYGGSLAMRLLKKAEVMIDQPLRRRDMDVASNINSAANHALLEVLSQVMA
ncbi:arginase [Agrobacterium sp. rho-13.3]|uniref:arginase n=1 Tax=Agrobacterium sp. rho-13.3 TaxID=3072980 RepID=UPI002A1645E9|nr:arginase [Agrobacterium sp. rho-13.3]MDX8308109.1 arginase [Agrobacterium sp. rho-13.3]